ncbi:MAG: hypothetical protein GF398_08530 [Chitinivibrionales bacterium]|nr:hypothetical protein [Chitinivibrionales bacterium]
MNMKKYLYVLVLGLLIAAGGYRCSVDPLASGGGTETGNPDVVAGARFAFELVDAGDKWRPEYYLDSGRTILDPARLVDNKAEFLAKKQATQDTVIGDSVILQDTIIIRNTLIDYDTIVRLDTIPLVDTLIERFTKHDSIEVISDGDTTLTILSKLVTDSVYVNDTAITADTFVYADTLYFTDTIVTVDTLVIRGDTLSRNRGGQTNDYSKLTGGSSLEPVYSVTTTYDGLFYDSVVGYQTKIENAPAHATAPKPGQMANMLDPSGYQVTSLTGLSSITRQFTAGHGNSHFERYDDADGDGLLAQAVFPQTPRASWFMRRIGGNEICSATVVFGRGNDNLFHQTADNVITSLVRHARLANTAQEAVYQLDTAFGSSGSMVLSLIERLPDTLEHIGIDYAIDMSSAGNPAHDTLSAIQARLHFRSSFLRSITFEIIPQEPVLPGGRITTALISIAVELASGEKGIMKGGMIDNTNGVLYGTYVKNLEEIDISQRR